MKIPQIESTENTAMDVLIDDCKNKAKDHAINERARELKKQASKHEWAKVDRLINELFVHLKL